MHYFSLFQPDQRIGEVHQDNTNDVERMRQEQRQQDSFRREEAAQGRLNK